MEKEKEIKWLSANVLSNAICILLMLFILYMNYPQVFVWMAIDVGLFIDGFISYHLYKNKLNIVIMILSGIALVMEIISLLV